MPSAPLPVVPSDCLLCGTCCFSDLPEYIRVFGVDHDRMDDDARALTEFIGNRCYMRIEDGHCAALVPDPETRRFVCSIYPMRPDACRSLDRGTSACLGELTLKQDRPPLALEALVRKNRSG
ncbi:YkgJ family cysteine cluster protein [Polyangium jinanense]|uniref:YkgJ family cysteine cluster protein n=1 Tax=Polyangium jinanense TaxID=2829994 RepID=A0A9X3X1V2_9BACT|nr:YkgJ family cysteine cluster protein [Polyangium jinanense]MDC3982614.1 YkgJ family cysteine cluster protein [Polyangium jinanense]